MAPSNRCENKGQMVLSLSVLALTAFRLPSLLSCCGEIDPVASQSKQYERWFNLRVWQVCAGFCCSNPAPIDPIHHATRSDMHAARLSIAPA